MKYSTALPLVSLVLGIAAEPVLIDREPTLVERDVPTITNILLAVGSGITTLDTAVKAFTGDSSTIDSDSAALQSTITSGTATVPGSGALTLNDAITLTAPVQALQGLGESLVNDLIAKKSAFEANKLCSDINSQVTGIQSASQALIDAIVALVPTAAQGIAASLAAPFEAALAEGVAAFAPSNCTDAATSSSTAASSSSTAASSSVAPTSSTPASSSSPASSSTGSPSSSTAASSGSHATSSGTATSASTPATYSTYPGTTPTGIYTSANATKSTSATKSGTQTSSSAVVTYTGAAIANYAANSFGVLALAAAALVL